ncbi:MAG: fatty acid desaturase family protein [Alphaproteobacteria bacterium]|jgi:beta-carotene hydroxylase
MVENTMKQEAEAARRHTPAFAWPTVVFTIALLAGMVVVTWLGAERTIPLWLAGVFNGLFIAAIYSPLHDASHNAILPRRKGWMWVNAAVGMASAAPIFMFHHHHKKSHIQHHVLASTDEDPDQYGFFGFWSALLVKVPVTILQYLNPLTLWRECHYFKMPRSEIILTMSLYCVYVAVIAVVLAMGYWLEFVTLWLAPWFLGHHATLMTLGWAPHQVGREQGRYRDTRISLFPGGDILFLWQNLHLVHHMLPMVPFYNYRKLFTDIRPHLEAHGARIEGLVPGSPPRG